MRKYLKKPHKNSKPSVTNWVALQRLALQRSIENEISESDPRVKLLSSTQADPERALRRLSILSKADIDREFGPKTQ